MKRRPALARRLLVVLSLATLPAVGAAQTNTAPAETAAPTPLTTSSITPTQPVRKRDRAISSDVAASLAAAMPKYNPPKPAPPPKPVEEQPDLREKLSSEALEPSPMSPEKFTQFMRADIARWTKLAQDRKIDLDA